MKTSKTMNTSFEFQGRDETIKIIDTGGNLVEYLTTQSAECPLFEADSIKLVKKLGEGQAGAPAWLINVPGAGRREYVAKIFTDKLEKIDIAIKALLEEYPPKRLINIFGSTEQRVEQVKLAIFS